METCSLFKGKDEWIRGRGEMSSRERWREGNCVGDVMREYKRKEIHINKKEDSGARSHCECHFLDEKSVICP